MLSKHNHKNSWLKRKQLAFSEKSRLRMSFRHDFLTIELDFLDYDYLIYKNDGSFYLGQEIFKKNRFTFFSKGTYLVSECYKFELPDTLELTKTYLEELLKLKDKQFPFEESLFYSYYEELAKKQFEKEELEQDIYLLAKAINE